MPNVDRSQLLRSRFRALFPLAVVDRPKPTRPRNEPWIPKPTGTGITPHGEVTLRMPVEWVRQANEPAAGTLRAKDAANAAALVRIAARADEPIPNCRHSLPVNAARMPKKPKARAKAPKKDFSQNALAIVLKATGSKQLSEPKVVKMPKRAHLRHATFPATLENASYATFGLELSVRPAVVCAWK